MALTTELLPVPGAPHKSTGALVATANPRAVVAVGPVMGARTVEKSSAEYGTRRPRTHARLRPGTVRNVKTLSATAAALESGELTAGQLVETCLARIQDPSGEGAAAFLAVDADRAVATANAVDAVRRAGGKLPPYSGIPIAVKDLCDIEGQITGAGSTILGSRPPAKTDAVVMGRIRRAGFVPIGRTNMTEFAYSGLGLNSHFGTPRSPWDRATGRIPGGSSSGTAVAVSDGMALAGLGTDTGGSCRIPAAFCGIVGFKPTASRVPLTGIVPLSPSLDSVGPLAPSVDCCAIVDDIFSGGAGRPTFRVRPPERIRLAVITEFVLDGLDEHVAKVFQRSLSRLSAADVAVTEIAFPELRDLPSINAKGGLATAEAYHWHRDLLATGADQYDQRVRVRIEPGADITAADYMDLLAERKRLIAAAQDRLVGFDAYILPTVAIVPPTLASFDSGDPGYYGSQNLLCLRNTAVGNFLDSCAISIPASSEGEAPVGLMLMAGAGADHELFTIARTVESLLR